MLHQRLIDAIAAGVVRHLHAFGVQVFAEHGSELKIIIDYQDARGVRQTCHNWSHFIINGHGVGIVG
jgi:hypothetical protein